MTGASIAAEVDAALREVAGDVGDGSFTVTLSQPAAQPVNPWDPPAGAPTDTELAALVQMYPRKLIDGTLIRTDDRKVMLPATGPRPSQAATLIIEGKRHAIIMVNDIAPSGVALYYEVQARINGQ